MFLYLKTDWLIISKNGGKIVITNPKDDNEQDCPLSLIEWVVLFGNIQLSTAAIRAFLKGKIPVFFLSNKGNYYWKLDTLEFKNVELLYDHIKASLDSEISLSYAKTFVKAKIANSRVMLQRRVRFYGVVLQVSHLETLQQDIVAVERAISKEQLRWLEGIAAKHYFDAMKSCISRPFEFTHRNRRPPKDPINSMLSLGYTLLAQNIQMVLDIQWINSQIWFFHEPKDLKTLLVLDIMEMFRSWIVDDLVIRVIRTWKITLDMFHYDEETGACLFSQDWLAIYLEQYYATMFREKEHDIAGKEMIKLKILEKTLEQFKQSISKQSHDYPGFLIK